MVRIRDIVATLLCLVASSAAAQLLVPTQWESALHSEHELIGKIWDSAGNNFVSADSLAEISLSAKYLILGEKHDNPDHHVLQLAFVNYLLEDEKLGRLVFEMMDSEEQALLDQIQQQDLDSLEQLKNYLQWDEEGWDWGYYGPLLQAAYRANVPLAAGNISNARVGEVYGLETLPESYNVLDELTFEQLNIDIDESHCGLLPASQFPAMVRVQQARDYSLATSMAAPAIDAVTVLITGNYHARKDLGVPNYLVSQHGDVSMDDIISIAFMEVSPEEDSPAAYLQQYGNVAAYDYIWFTPVISEEDYCASLRQ